MNISMMSDKQEGIRTWSDVVIDSHPTGRRWCQIAPGKNENRREDSSLKLKTEGEFTHLLWKGGK